MPTNSPLSKISDYVFFHADHSPETEAMVWNDTRVNYRSFAQQVENVSQALIAYGIQKGDRVALLGSPRPEFFIVMMATVDIGAIWMGMHPRYKITEFRHVVDTAQPKLIFAFDEIDDRNYAVELKTLRSEFASVAEFIIFDNQNPATGISFDNFLSAADRVTSDSLKSLRESVETDDPAVIIFTSGTTGRPKGAMNSHYGLVHCAHIELSRWPGKNMRVLQNMPINHIANIGMMSSYALVDGGTLVFMDQFDPGAILHTIEHEKITFWLQAPAMFHMAMNHENFPQTDLSSLQYIIWGGGPMPQHMVESLRKAGATLAMAYGMTELTAYVSYSDLDADSEVLANSIGKPEAHYDLRLMGSNGELANPGQSGEIQARGRWLMRGYFNQKEATDEAYTEDGWFKTGDIAECRTDGNWKLVGRTKEMYKSGGFNVYPREIEIAIEEHNAVAMSAVLGVSDPLYDEVGYAFVQLQPGANVDISELHDWCHEKLANYKVPKTFQILSELPKLPIGKIDKQYLRRQLASFS
jgi:acyl-CoA synthetase (AMP-forming)/AMP-acid ligase II